MKSKDIRSERKVKRTYVRIGFIGILLTAGILFTILLLNSSAAGESPAKDSSTVNTQTSDATVSDAQNKKISSMTPAQRNALRKAAAERLDAVIAEAGALAEPTLVPGTDGLLVPDYFGIYPNYATSQLPTIDPATGAISGGIRKFVDSLPGLGPGGANNLGQYIPIAVADNTTYPGSDYYEIALVEYREQMHPDLTPTTLRGYVQLDTAVIPGTGVPLTNLDGTQILKGDGSQAYAVDNPHYLGPLILAQKDKPVRIKFTNFLPTGAGGDLFIPVDTTIMGAGMGPVDGEMYTQNRATLHLHGGRSPWISDGTPHQWTTPALAHV